MKTLIAIQKYFILRAIDLKYALYEMDIPDKEFEELHGFSKEHFEMELKKYGAVNQEELIN